MMTIHAVAENVQSKLYYWDKHAFASRESAPIAAAQRRSSAPAFVTCVVFYAQKPETTAVSHHG